MESAANIIITGILIGALISAPMGPIGMLVIQRTLNKGRMPAFVTGIGAALSDLIYCLLTGLGLSFVTDFIESNQNVLQVIGSLVLIIYGISLPQQSIAAATHPRPAGLELLARFRHRLPLHILQSADTVLHHRTLRTLQLS